MVLMWLEIWVVGCTSAFAPQDAGVLEASEAMQGHHPEPCPCCVLQQGKLVVDMSCALGQCVRGGIQGSQQSKRHLHPRF